MGIGRSTLGQSSRIQSNRVGGDASLMKKVVSFLGGSAIEEGGYDIAVDNVGTAYVTGYTLSNDFPIANAQQPSFGGSTDAFVTAIQPDGKKLLYSTYLGGSGGDAAWGLAIDTRGNAYVTGQTESTNFPMAYPAQSTYGGGDND